MKSSPKSVLAPKPIIRYILAGAIAASSISYLVRYPEPAYPSDAEANNPAFYQNLAEPTIYNYQSGVMEHPDCDTDSDCENKYCDPDPDVETEECDMILDRNEERF